MLLIRVRENTTISSWNTWAKERLPNEEDIVLWKILGMVFKPNSAPWKAYCTFLHVKAVLCMSSLAIWNRWYAFLRSRVEKILLPAKDLKILQLKLLIFMQNVEMMKSQTRPEISIFAMQIFFWYQNQRSFWHYGFYCQSIYCQSVKFGYSFTKRHFRTIANQVFS